MKWTRVINIGLVLLMMRCGLTSSAAQLLEARFDRFDAGCWKIEGRGQSGVREGVLRLTGCEAAAGEAGWSDYELRFRARAPRDASEVQIWASVRRTARDSRYAIGLRGGNNHQLYIARIAPNGRQAFLGMKPLDFEPRPGEWYRVRIVVAGRSIVVYLNENTSPSMEVSDNGEGWLEHGGIALGGGYLPAEFDDVVVRALKPDAEVAGTDGFNAKALKFNFQPEAVAAAPGWLKATGAAYDERRGYGWARNMKSGERKRNKMADPVRDTVLSVAGSFYENEFRVKVPNGDYLVTLWAGDPGFAIIGRFTFQGEAATSAAVSLRAGQFSSIVRTVHVGDGLLRLKVERTTTPGVSMQGVVVEKRADLPPGRWELAQAPQKQAERHARETEVKRRRQREAYRPAVIGKLEATRTDISLDGRWLFLPEYEFKSGVNNADPDLNDQAWHVMDVPALWTPADNWLYDDRQGGSDRWVELERTRLAQYTFDWQKTKVAWYRHSFELKEPSAGRRFELNFEAIAKVAEIWVNGQRVGTNVGMFRPAQVEITPWVRQGRNSIAVRVAALGSTDDTKSDKVAAVAVTVAVTERMLNSLPQAIYNGKPGGIWQPVTLVVRQAVQVKDVYFQPRLDGAKVELTLENQTDKACKVTPAIAFISRRDGAPLKQRSAFPAVTLKAGEVTSITLDTGLLTPELWSPATPNLYTMNVALRSGGRLLDERRLEVGFRTVEVRQDGRIYLNGKPYWLRGACHTPMPTCPNDAALADTFTRLMHEGNVRVSRTVCAPWNELWLSRADRNGVGISQEGTWAWLMLDGKMPNPEILDAWRQEYLALIKKDRNHPSILFWTVNNESYYVRNKDPEVLEKTMTVLSDTIKALRAIDPSRPICPDSGGVYSMFPPFYKKMEREKGFDYGDIDDKHDYTSWYTNSFFQHYPGQPFAEQFRKWTTPGRPLISQEKATGYPNADDGHAVRKYIFDHMVPQAWVGDYAYEHQDPKYILESVAFNTKELAETMRCYYRDSMAGVVHFALNCWYQNLFEAGRIKPYEAARGLATALRPVLVSARFYGRHFYAGARPQVSLFVANDDEAGRDLGPTRLAWSLECAGKALASGEHALPAVPYYHNLETTLTLVLPERLPRPRVDARLLLKLSEGDRLVSQNNYDLALAEPEWVKAPEDVTPLILDPGKSSAALWRLAGVTPRWSADVPESHPPCLVVCDYGWVRDAARRERFLRYVDEGGLALLCAPGSALKNLFPGIVTAFRPGDREIVTMRVPESPVFDGIEVMDLRWFDRGDRGIPLATHGDFKLAESQQVEILAKDAPVHGYLTTQQQRAELEGAVIFTVKHGKGRIWVTQLAHETGVHDPIAARVLRNLLNTAWVTPGKK